ncbi:hypothetical protein F5Y12DRAFT_778755 [Xylaria sp. FL1777]|nr:hypothetical protein F5Y12DRAFT_778755 [Xylaria sp. FL1777]
MVLDAMNFHTLIAVFLASIHLSYASTDLSIDDIPPPSPRWYPLACWTYGEKFEESYKIAADYTAEACNNVLGNRNYTEMQKATACYNIGFDKRVDFTVALRKYPARFLPSEECRRRLLPIVLLCRHGGRRVYHDWKFKADPNRGLC